MAAWPSIGPNGSVLLAALHVALHAETLLQRDRDYIVRGGRVDLVDEFTGRVADNRRWPHGIQPAVEAKEGVEVRTEGRILGSIPIQHFVRLYPKVAGMTATAVPAAEELKTFYGLTTVVFPTNQPCRRVDEPDVVFTDRGAKDAALLDEIVRVHATGRPILVGTASVRESEALAKALTRRHVKCRVLNARHDAREARIVARAGALGAVTISTNMAGRGTDIVLGGGDSRARDAVVALGGLYVIGTNRHESRRIDDQLRGRAGRQGDPGSSRFYISLEDDLIQRYGVMTLIPKRHRPSPQGTPVDDPVVHREIARAQRIIEGQNFEIRKTLWQYSALVDEQRRTIAAWRQALLRDEIEPKTCEEDAAAHHADLAAAVGPATLRRVENLLTMRVIDQHWSDHLGTDRGYPRGHPPPAVRRPRAVHRVQPADCRGVCHDDGGGAGRDGGGLPASVAGGGAHRSRTGRHPRAGIDLDVSHQRQSLLASRRLAHGGAQHRVFRGGRHAGRDVLAGHGSRHSRGVPASLVASQERRSGKAGRRFQRELSTRHRRPRHIR